MFCIMLRSESVVKESEIYSRELTKVIIDAELKTIKEFKPNSIHRKKQIRQFKTELKDNFYRDTMEKILKPFAEESANYFVNVESDNIKRSIDMLSKLND